MTHYRDAVTGEYVTEKYAKANPDTTVAETEIETQDAHPDAVERPLVDRHPEDEETV